MPFSTGSHGGSPLERDILDAPSLDDFLRHAPDAFEFALGGTSQLDEFRLIYLLVNGMDGFNAIQLHAVDILVIIDAGIDDAQHRFSLTEIHAKLGQRAKLLSSHPTFPSSPHSDHPSR